MTHDPCPRVQNAVALVLGDLACVAAQTVHFDRYGNVNCSV